MDAANQLGGSSSYGVQGYGPLPVTWLSFNASWNGSNAKLQWSTAAEINNDRFEIERSFDNISFEIIGDENSSQNGNINNYVFEDAGAKENGKEVLYYRIKQVDNDGKYSYSNIQMLRTQSANKNSEINIIAYPNPVVENTNIRISGNMNGSVTYTLLDIDGRTIKTETVNSASGIETIKVIDMSGLAKGTYLLNIKTNSTVQTLRLVKIDR